jgi:hypothetical protein
MQRLNPGPGTGIVPTSQEATMTHPNVAHTAPGTPPGTDAGAFPVGSDDVTFDQAQQQHTSSIPVPDQSARPGTPAGGPQPAAGRFTSAGGDGNASLWRKTPSAG